VAAPNDLRLLSFPSSDATFREDVRRAGEALVEDMSDEQGHSVIVEQLRHRYRSVEVVTQDNLAQHELLPIRVWYIFRDGRVRPPNDRRERLYVAMAAARRTIDVSRTAMADARSVARAAGFDEEELEVAEEAVGGLPPPWRPTGATRGGGPRAACSPSPIRIAARP
jgi:hypothetical protein